MKTDLECPLICIPSPRDIDEFTKSLRDLDHYDQYIVKYYKAPEAYDELRRFFLSQQEFDPMVCFADDLIVTPEGLKQLLHDGNQNPKAVLSGACNFDMYNHQETYAFCLKTEPGVFPPIGGLAQWLAKANTQMHQKYLVPVSFNGFACVVIPRHIIEKIPFRHDTNGSGVDTNFCDDCMKAGIEMYVDVSVMFTHLGGRNNGMLENWGVGIKPKQTIYYLSIHTNMKKLVL